MRKTLYDKFLNFDRFRASVKYQLVLRNWTYKTLSAKTGYSVSYLTALLRGNGSKKAMREVCEVLGLNPKDFK
ncbi:MAG: helix-turn-helix transcriptional regulator [Lachnospiraceae bacterium]|nr:helix-turn-helix transcriptional regulator [Ruminococcus sp.]MCM1276142.1 helix-turn-helix transcriptional regulator [Lachnospiraceae bacterium]